MANFRVVPTRMELSRNKMKSSDVVQPRQTKNPLNYFEELFVPSPFLINFQNAMQRFRITFNRRPPVGVYKSRLPDNRVQYGAASCADVQSLLYSFASRWRKLAAVGTCRFLNFNEPCPIMASICISEL